MSVIDALRDVFWLDREHEIVTCREQAALDTVNTDAFWVPNPQETKLEVDWDKSRLDAFEMLSAAQMRGDAEIDLRAIARASAVGVDTEALPFYECDGQRVMPEMIVAYNEQMLRNLLVVEAIK